VDIGPNTSCGKAFPLLGCYCFVLNQLSWNDAQTNCQNNYMTLASIDTASKQNVLNSLIAAGGYRSNSFWTSGAHNTGVVPFQWQWTNLNNQAIPNVTGASGYSNWCINEPDNPGTNQGRLAVYNQCWYDTPASNPHYSICEQADESGVSFRINFHGMIPPPDKK